MYVHITTHSTTTIFSFSKKHDSVRRKTYELTFISKEKKEQKWKMKEMVLRFVET